MSHGKQTSNWVQENLPLLHARGPEVFGAVIEQAIRNTRYRRFWTVLVVILVPAILVNVFHADIAATFGGAISRPLLLGISVIVTATAAAKLSAAILHREIETLSRDHPN